MTKEAEAMDAVQVPLVPSENTIQSLIRYIRQCAWSRDNVVKIWGLLVKEAALSTIGPNPSFEPQAYYDAILSCLDRYQPMAEKAERRDLVEFMDQLRDEIGNRAPLNKLNRWLGYIQGVLIEIGHTDVLTERDWSRPLFRPLDFAPLEAQALAPKPKVEERV